MTDLRSEPLSSKASNMSLRSSSLTCNFSCNTTFRVCNISGVVIRLIDLIAFNCSFFCNKRLFLRGGSGSFNLLLLLVVLFSALFFLTCFVVDGVSISSGLSSWLLVSFLVLLTAAFRFLITSSLSDSPLASLSLSLVENKSTSSYVT